MKKLLGNREKMGTAALKMTKLMFLNSLQTPTSLYLQVGRRASEQPDHHGEVGDLVEAGDQHAEQKHDPGLA